MNMEKKIPAVARSSEHHRNPRQCTAGGSTNRSLRDLARRTEANDDSVADCLFPKTHL